jgi:hypothetical protein
MCNRAIPLPSLTSDRSLGLGSRHSFNRATVRSCCSASSARCACSEIVVPRVEDVAVSPGGLRLRILRGKTDQAGQGAEIGLPRGRHVETCPVRALDAWQAVARRKAGPLFRKISTGDGIGEAALHPDAVRRILAHRVQMAGLSVDGFDRLSAHALRVGFITEAYKGVRDEDIMRHTRHRDFAARPFGLDSGCGRVHRRPPARRLHPLDGKRRDRHRAWDRPGGALRGCLRLRPVPV